MSIAFCSFHLAFPQCAIRTNHKFIIPENQGGKPIVIVPISFGVPPSGGPEPRKRETPNDEISESGHSRYKHRPIF
jgi:hypothetical protein